VFFSIIYFGVRARGVGGYLKTFAESTIIMIPLNVVETFTRTFSLIVRLFGIDTYPWPSGLPKLKHRCQAESHFF
jgi:hypothetical protein